MLVDVMAAFFLEGEGALCFKVAAAVFDLRGVVVLSIAVTPLGATFVLVHSLTLASPLLGWAPAASCFLWFGMVLWWQVGYQLSEEQ